MRQIKQIPVTKEGFEALQKELNEIIEERKVAVVNLSEARNMGDLSENGLYHAAKARLRSIDSNAFRLKIQIKLAQVIDISKSDRVEINSKLTVNDGKSDRDLHIVGDYEANPLEGKISRRSPLGSALLGKRIGETVQIETPSGIKKYTVTSIN